MISRETSEVFMPAVPIVIPSEIAIVFSSIGVPPASRMPVLDLRGERAQVEVARHRLDPRRGDRDERARERLVVVADALEVGARRGALGPSVSWRLRCLTSNSVATLIAPQHYRRRPPRASRASCSARRRSQRARRGEVGAHGVGVELAPGEVEVRALDQRALVGASAPATSRARRRRAAAASCRTAARGRGTRRSTR